MLVRLLVFFLVSDQSIQPFELQPAFIVPEQDFNFFFDFSQFLVAVLDQTNAFFERRQGIF